MKTPQNEPPSGLPLAPCSASWIPTNDRMPTGEYDEEWVLVLTKCGEMAVARLDWEQGHRGEFWHVARDHSFELSAVTFWMPLPLPPNVEVKRGEPTA